MNKLLLTLLFSIGACAIWAQFGPSSIGEWKAIVPHQTGREVVETKNSIVYVTESGLLSFDKSDLSMSYMTKTDGLSSANPALIAYSSTTNTLILSYENNDIDLLVDGEVVNLPFIKEANNIIGSKKINALVTKGDYLYILADFGIVQFDLVNTEVITTVKTGFPVYDFDRFDDRYVLAGEEGLYQIDTSVNTITFTFFGSWDNIESRNGLFFDSPIVSIFALDTFLLLGTPEGQLLKITTSGELDTLADYPNSIVSFIGKDNDKGYYYIVACQDGQSCDRNIFHVDKNGQLSDKAGDCTDRPTCLVEDEKGRLWFGDRYSDFRWKESLRGECHRVRTNTPRVADVFDVDFTDDGGFWITTGSYDLSNVTFFKFLSFTYLRYRDGQWEDYSWYKDEILKENDFGIMCNMAIDYDRNKVYLASFLDGLLEISGEDQTAYNDRDDNLGFNPGDPIRTEVFDVEVAPNGDVWMSNFRANEPIRVKRVNGTWEKYRAKGRVDLTDLVIDDYGNKWYVDVSGTNGLVVFNDHGTSSPADDEVKLFSAANSELATNDVKFIEKDLDGAIWIGTAKGIMVFDCQSSVFDDVCTGYRPVIIADGLPENLLNDESITAIDVDGGNNKWFGTLNGVFVFSPDGQDLLAHYTADDSPLLSNEITCIKANKKTGEIYIGTSSGLNLLQSSARQGEEYHKPSLHVYPNPVQPEYRGSIAIDGLAQDSDFRITDVSGRVVYKSKSTGGQAIWDGTDVNHQRVTTGVYLIWGATTSDDFNSDGIVGKVLIITD